MNTNFFIDIGVAVILRLLAGGKVPASYIKALTKLRDALNLAFPPESNKPAAHIRVQAEDDPEGGETSGPGH